MVVCCHWGTYFWRPHGMLSHLKEGRSKPAVMAQVILSMWIRYQWCPLCSLGLIYDIGLTPRSLIHRNINSSSRFLRILKDHSFMVTFLYRVALPCPFCFILLLLNVFYWLTWENEALSIILPTSKNTHWHKESMKRL